MSYRYEILKNYREQVQTEIDANSQISAFILSYNYIEFFITEILKLNFKNKDKKNKIEHIETIINKVESIKYFEPRLILFATNLTLDEKLYQKLNQINSFRNNLAHKSITMDIQSSKFKKTLNKKIEESMIVCDKLDEMLYTEVIESIKPQIMKLTENLSKGLENFKNLPKEINEKLKIIKDIPKKIIDSRNNLKKSLKK